MSSQDFTNGTPFSFVLIGCENVKFREIVSTCLRSVSLLRIRFSSNERHPFFLAVTLYIIIYEK